MCTRQHPLEDPKEQNGQCVFPGQDYSNVRVKDFINVDKYDIQLIDRNQVPRMPWQDVSVSVQGSAAKDLAHHFIQYWNHAKTDIAGTKQKDFVVLKPSYIKPGKVINIKYFDFLSQAQTQRNLTVKPNQSKVQKYQQEKNSSNAKQVQIPQLKAQSSQFNDNIGNNHSSAIIQQADIQIMAPPSRDLFHENVANQSELQEFKSEAENNTQAMKQLSQANIIRMPSLVQNGNMSINRQKTFGSSFINRNSLHFATRLKQKQKNQAPIFRRSTTTILKPTGEKVQLHDIEQDMMLGIPIATKNQEIKLIEERTSDQLLQMKKSKRQKAKNAFKNFFGIHVKNDQQIKKQLYIKNYVQLMQKKDLEQEEQDRKIAAAAAATASPFRKQKTTVKQKIKQFTHEVQELENEQGPQFQVEKQKSVNKNEDLGNCICQILRSASGWSTGLAKGMQQKSIYQAYITLIAHADHFIYIENQFFISNPGGRLGDKNIVENRIAESLVLRIEKAHQMNQNFKVLVIIPLLPGFEGDVKDSGSALLRLQLHYEYQTICRGGNSIIQRLQQMNIPAQKYIEFYGL